MPAPSETPTELGRYRIVRRLGAGGMAEVFLAKTSGAQGIEKTLVVKRVLPEFARSPKFLRMFVDEAKVAMRLNHPNIVQVYAFEQVGRDYVLAMELVDGPDLGRLVAEARRLGRRLPPGLAAYVVGEVAKGLDYAHRRRDESGLPLDIVHRDVSPQNVLLSYQGGVKIADFGIARAALVDEEHGIIKGKFTYMSPEQARGQPVDRRSDVYSLGVLLGELLMNRPMYPGKPGMEVLEQVRAGRRTLPREIDRAVPEALHAVVEKATMPEPDDRFAGARGFSAALSRWLHVQDELSDAETLERFLAEVAPKHEQQADRPAERTSHAPTEVSVDPSRELRERRYVLALQGLLRMPARARIVGVESPEGSSLGRTATRVLEDVAYKYDAVLEQPDGADAPSFRFVVGLVRPSVDDPLHAARLALDVLDALSGLSADREEPFAVSLGLSRGLVTTARRAGAMRFEAVDPVFEVASTLAASGDAGEVRVSSEVYRLIRRTFAVDAADPIDVDTGHGRTTVRAFRLLGASRGEASPEREGDDELVGRTEPLAALLRVYEEVVGSGRSEYLAVVGELGVGKTALVSTALGRLDPRPQVLRVDCLFGASAVPYAAVVELVRAAFQIPDGAEGPEARRLLRAGVRALLPTAEAKAVIDPLAPLVSFGRRAAPPEAADRAVAITRAVRRLLGALARRGPLVVWVDALQFADRASLNLIARLTRRQHEAPLLLVLGSRLDDAVENALDGIPRLTLSELDHDARHALITSRFGGAEVPPDIAEDIITRAGGNAFFLNELIDALLDRGALRLDDQDGELVVARTGEAFALPTTLEDVVAARLAALPESERRAIRWLAVAGGGLRAEDLASVAGSAVSRELPSLEAKGLVTRRPRGQLGFSSPVVRLKAYESLDADDRMRMHRQVARLLQRGPADVPPARIAHHLERAGEAEEAAQTYLAAGADAESKHSLEDALRFYGQAVDLAQKGSARAFAALEASEELLRRLGRREQQRDVLERLRVIAERTGEHGHVATAFNRLARFDLDVGRFAGVEAMLGRALDAAIAGGEKAPEVEALGLLGQLRRDRGDVDGAIGALDRALVRARHDARLLPARASALVHKAILQWRSGRPEEALEAAAEGLVIARRLGLRSQEASALNALGVALAVSGDLEDAIRVIRASIVIDREIGDRLHLGRKLSNLGQLYARLGDAEQALGFLERSLTVFDLVDDAAGRVDALSAMADVMAARDPEGAAKTIGEARRLAAHLEDPYDLAQVALVEGRLALRSGHPDAAATFAREAADRARTCGASCFSRGHSSRRRSSARGTRMRPARRPSRSRPMSGAASISRARLGSTTSWRRCSRGAGRRTRRPSRGRTRRRWSSIGRPGCRMRNYA